jgi:transglutaminase-like putative cysteine protease
MTRRARELETLLLTMFAAVPLYFTTAIGPVPVAIFHVAMAAIVLRVASGRTPELIPAQWMRWLAIAYIPCYFVDWRVFSGTAIAASTHLVLFIAFYQPIESMQRDNQSQRMLTAALIFVASLATSTHVTVVPFVLLFAFLMFRQLMYVSHLETARSVEQTYAEAPSGRAAGFYLAGSIVIGAMLFPLLPRVRSPFMSGMAGALAGSSSALTETIDFRQPRTSASDPTIVARVWIATGARDLFAPMRLRAMVYDRFERSEWRQSPRGLREVPLRVNTYILGRPSGATAEVIVQQRAERGKILIPVGAYSLTGLPSRLYEGPARDTYVTYYDAPVNLRVGVSEGTEPLRMTRVTSVNYPVTPEIAAMARRIVGDETQPERQARLIEQHLMRNFRYEQNGGNAAKIMSVEDFLLRTRAGQCEYFAAGVVVLMTSLDVPARIAGGFYGGRRNPLTGYYSIRREDAHAWTEVWNGTRWVMFDATPVALRPGSSRINPVREYAAAISDSLTFAWDRYVLTYGLGDQAVLAEGLIEWTRATATSIRGHLQSSARTLASPDFLSAIALLVAMALLVALIRGRRRPLFELLASHLARHGIEVGPSMTMEEALQRLRVEKPETARALEPLIAMYEEERFSAHVDRGRVGRIRRGLSEAKS